MKKQSTLGNFFHNVPHRTRQQKYVEQQQPIYCQKSTGKIWNGHMYGSRKMYHDNYETFGGSSEENDVTLSNSQEMEDFRNFSGNYSQSQDNSVLSISSLPPRLHSSFSSISSLDVLCGESKPLDEDFRQYVDKEKAAATKRDEIKMNQDLLSTCFKLNENLTRYNKAIHHLQTVPDKCDYIKRIMEKNSEEIENLKCQQVEMKAKGLSDLQLVHDLIIRLRHESCDLSKETLSNVNQLKKCMLKDRVQLLEASTQYSPQLHTFQLTNFDKPAKRSPVSVVSPVQMFEKEIVDVQMEEDDFNFSSTDTSKLKIRINSNRKSLHEKVNINIKNHGKTNPEAQKN
uniref:Uncharacterized protein n=1 Tax=Ciona savignyi TaxID=51511 RepID=H2ZR66_CIOSA